VLNAPVSDGRTEPLAETAPEVALAEDYARLREAFRESAAHERGLQEARISSRTRQAATSVPRALRRLRRR
jgi:hypothetical protein